MMSLSIYLRMNNYDYHCPLAHIFISINHERYSCSTEISSTYVDYIITIHKFNLLIKIFWLELRESMLCPAIRGRGGDGGGGGGIKYAYLFYLQDFNWKMGFGCRVTAATVGNRRTYIKCVHWLALATVQLQEPNFSSGGRV